MMKSEVIKASQAMLTYQIKSKAILRKLRVLL